MARRKYPTVSEAGKDAVAGRNTLRFNIPGALMDEGELMVEMRAFAPGPRGGQGTQMSLTPEYWAGLLLKLSDYLYDEIARAEGEL